MKIKICEYLKEQFQNSNIKSKSRMMVEKLVPSQRGITYKFDESRFNIIFFENF